MIPEFGCEIGAAIEMSYLLVVDDHDDLRAAVSLLLRVAGHEVAMAADGHQALASVSEREPDLIVLDLWMPGLSGFAVCRVLKQNPFTARIPVLMLTAQSDVDHKIEGFEAGADDYLAKPFEPRELQARVTSLLRLVQREGERNPSSGLPGGVAIEAEIARRLALQRENGAAFCVGYLDLDHFKSFADTFGFAIADQVIRAMGPALRNALASCGSPDDFAGHIGGDDFIVVTSADKAEIIARATSAEFSRAVAQAIGEEAMQRGTFRGAGSPRQRARISSSVFGLCDAYRGSGAVGCHLPSLLAKPCGFFKTSGQSAWRRCALWLKSFNEFMNELPRIQTTVVGSYPVPDWLPVLPSEQSLIDATRAVFSPFKKWRALILSLTASYIVSMSTIPIPTA